MAKYNDLTMGQIEALVNKMGGMQVALAFLRDEYKLTLVAKATSKLIVRKVAVDRTRSLQESIEATGRVQYVDQSVVATVPRCEGEFEATFVNLGRWVPASKLVEELANEGWELIADPQGQADMNRADPAFADKYPNATQWQDANGNFCSATFGRWDGERDVDVNRNNGSWSVSWWFPCRRKALGT